jgi:hypothetical protein
MAAALKATQVAFNWGAMRRHHSGYKQLRDAIARGEIGAPRHAAMYFFTDLITHHPHTLDTVSMLLGDPAPEWVEGRLVEPGDRRRRRCVGATGLRRDGRRFPPRARSTPALPGFPGGLPQWPGRRCAVWAWTWT